MPRALLLSPRLGDIAFGCGATAHHLVRGGWDVRLITVFGAPDAAAQDAAFGEIIGVENCEFWALGDAADVLARLQSLETPDAVFAPQGLGDDEQTLKVIRAIRARGWDAQAFWYREIPAALRAPAAAALPLLPANLSGGFVAFDEAAMQLKIAGCRVYRARVAAEFGDADALARQLTDFHRAEARAVARQPFAERFVVGV